VEAHDMAEIIQETVTTERSNVGTVKGKSQREATTSQTIEYLIYFFFGIVEVLLFFRIVLMLTGASRGSSFVDMIYSFTGIFVLPFEGIFRSFFAKGVETTSVLEPAALVAVIVYPLLAFGIVKLLRVISGEKEVE
jgi:hypothetical protein